MPLSSRKTFELALLALPDEAFGYVVAAAWENPVMKTNKIFPDGLGGFLPESQAAIHTLQAAANGYMQTGGK